MRAKLTLAAVAAIGLSGCFGGSSAPSELLTLTPAQVRETAQPRAAEQGQVVTVTTPVAPQALNTNRVPVYVSPTSIQYLTGAQWVEEPNELFRTLLSETVAARTSLVVIDPALYTQVQGMVLSGQLMMFGLDPNSMEVVVQFQATLARPQQAVVTNRFEARIPVAAAEAAQVAPALNQAANRVAADVAAWIGS